MSGQPTDPGGPDQRGDEHELDTLFSALANEPRRTVLRYFRSTDADVATVDELVDYMHSQDSVTGDRDRLRLRLHHATLPHLAALGFVDYDPRSNTVRGRTTKRLERVLDAVREIEVLS